MSQHINLKLAFPTNRSNCIVDVSVNCIWGEWTDGNCSVPCGGGYQINFREKLVSEMYGGECEGDSETEEQCNMHMCPGKI